jgi:hypothetical protein
MSRHAECSREQKVEINQLRKSVQDVAAASGGSAAVGPCSPRAAMIACCTAPLATNESANAMAILTQMLKAPPPR